MSERCLPAAQTSPAPTRPRPSDTQRQAHRAWLLAQVDTLHADVVRLTVLHEALLRALGWAAADRPVDAATALQQAVDEADADGTAAVLRPERWPDGGLTEPWIRSQLEAATVSLARLHASAVVVLHVQLEQV